MDGPELAARLLASGKPVTPQRIGKLKKHLRSVDQYQALLEALPEDVRAQVDAVLAQIVQERFA